jgi:cysteine desulfurase
MTSLPIIYLDNNATTSCAPEVVAEMLPFFREHFGNTSSAHLSGRNAYRAVETARDKLASLLSVKSHELFFNSGATEGNNWIFQSVFQTEHLAKRRIVVSATEHKSVLDTALRLRKTGFDVQVLPVNRDGVVDLAQAASLITPETVLVSVQYANNETGVIQPITELINLSHEVGAFFHCDAVQGLGKAVIDLAALQVDSAVFSAHKVHGPKGVGALFIRGGARNWNFDFPLTGGGQEHLIRPGTLNVPGIVGFGLAAELIQTRLIDDIVRMKTLQETLESQLTIQIPNCKIHGAHVQRIPNTTNVFLPGVPSDTLILNLPFFCVSSGSACNSGTISPSHVLLSMGVTNKENRESVRISFSRDTTSDEVSNFLIELCNVYRSLPKL